MHGSPVSHLELLRHLSPFVVSWSSASAPLRAFPELSAASVVLAHTSLAWEMAAWELWGALLRGGALALPAAASFDLDALAADARTLCADACCLTPRLFLCITPRRFAGNGRCICIS